MTSTKDKVFYLVQNCFMPVAEAQIFANGLSDEAFEIMLKNENSQTDTLLMEIHALRSCIADSGITPPLLHPNNKDLYDAKYKDPEVRYKNPMVEEVKIYQAHVDQLRERLLERYSDLLLVDEIMEFLLAGVKITIQPKTFSLNFGDQVSLTAFNRMGEPATSDNMDGPLFADFINTLVSGISPACIKAIQIPKIDYAESPPRVLEIDVTIIPFFNMLTFPMTQGGGVDTDFEDSSLNRKDCISILDADGDAEALERLGDGHI